MNLNELNLYLSTQFPKEKLGDWELQFSGWKAANPFEEKYKSDPLKWKLCAAQYFAYNPKTPRNAYQVTLTMTELALKDEANMERITGMVELYRQYLRYMLAAAEVLNKDERQSDPT